MSAHDGDPFQDYLILNLNTELNYPRPSMRVGKKKATHCS